jgi:lactoylglutathione lyase
MATPIHSMIRVLDEARALAFYKAAFHLETFDRIDFDTFTLLYLRAPGSTFELELTVNKGTTEPYALGNGYGHLAVSVDNLSAEHARMEKEGLSPGPLRSLQRDGKPFGEFFFIKDPDGYSIEVLQRGGRFL